MTRIEQLAEIAEQATNSDTNDMERAILKHGALLAELERTKQTAASQEQSIFRMSAELDLARGEAARLLRERNFYMTHSTKLATQLDSIAQAYQGHAQAMANMIAAARNDALDGAGTKAPERPQFMMIDPLTAHLAREQFDEQVPARVKTQIADALDRSEQPSDLLDDDGAREIAQRFAPVDPAPSAKPEMSAGRRLLLSLS